MTKVRNRARREMSVPVTSKGQVTIPVEVRKLLGIEAPGRVTFAVSENGEVTLRAPRFPTLDAVVGYFGQLSPARPWDEVLAIARAEGAVGADRTANG